MNILGYGIDIGVLTHSALLILGKIVVALIILFVGKWLAAKAALIADKLMQRSRLDTTVSNFLSNLLYGVLLVVVVLAALSKVGINTTSVVAILGGAAVAVGISLKDQLSNFAAGVIIILFRPFNRGDYVSINSQVGTVKDISLVNTRLMTVNNHEVIIPNSDITTSATINYTSLPNRRVDVTVSVSYDADLKIVKELMIEMAQNHELAFADPAPIIRVTNLGDHSVDLTLNVWTTNADWWALQCDLLEHIKDGLDGTDDIPVPYPQRRLHIENLQHVTNSIQAHTGSTAAGLEKPDAGTTNP